MARKEYRVPRVPNGGVEVKLSYRGIGKLLNSSAMALDLHNRASRIAEAADASMDRHFDTEQAGEPVDHHKVEISRSKSRIRVRVYARSIEAMIAEEYDRNLTKAVDAGRG